jgi:hypothetical protein
MILVEPVLKYREVVISYLKIAPLSRPEVPAFDVPEIQLGFGWNNASKKTPAYCPGREISITCS